MSWSDRWQLGFNVNKCKVLHMGLTNMQHKYTMKYGNDKVALSEVESAKDLGIMFDSEMKFQAHINDVCNRGYQRIAVIRRTYTYMDKNTCSCCYIRAQFSQSWNMEILSGVFTSKKKGKS